MHKAQSTLFGAINIADVLAEIDFRMQTIAHLVCDSTIKGEAEDELRKLSAKYEALEELRKVILEEAKTQK